MWLRIVALAKERDSDLFRQLVDFPDNLPDLSRLRPPRNARSEGLLQCRFALRERGELPVEY